MRLSTNALSSSVGGIHIIREISTGPSNCVFLGKRTYHSGKEVMVALKVFQFPLEEVQRHKESFLKEVQFLQKLRHPHILPIISTGIDRGVPFVATEYSPYGSLYDLMQKVEPGPLPWKQALLIIKQIAKAVQYAQSLGVMHCNLKPGNILFNKRGMVQITDFHIPSLRSMDLSASSISSAFLAPEQLVDIVSPQSDQYALGCIAYQLLTGKPPFTGRPGLQTKIMQPVPPAQINPVLPSHANQAILKAMAQRLSERYTTIQAFIDALSAPESVQAFSVPNKVQSLQPEDSVEAESAPAAPEEQPQFPSTLPATPSSLSLVDTHEIPQVVPDAHISLPTAASTSDNLNEPQLAPLKLVQLKGYSHTNQALHTLVQLKDTLHINQAPPKLLPLKARLPSNQVPLSPAQPTNPRRQSPRKGRFKLLFIACIIALISGGILLPFITTLTPPHSKPTSWPSAHHTTPSLTPTTSTDQHPTSVPPPGMTVSPTATPSTIPAQGTAIVSPITPTPSPTSIPSPTPTSSPVQLLTIYPAYLHPYDCSHKSYYFKCFLTLSLSSYAANSTSWYIVDSNIGVSLNPPQGQLSPGESINITALIYTTCNNTGQLTFTSSVAAAVMKWTC